MPCFWYFLPYKACITVYICSEIFCKCTYSNFCLHCWFTQFYVAFSYSVYDTVSRFLICWQQCDRPCFFALLEMTYQHACISKDTVLIWWSQYMSWLNFDWQNGLVISLEMESNPVSASLLIFCGYKYNPFIKSLCEIWEVDVYFSVETFFLLV